MTNQGDWKSDQTNQYFGGRDTVGKCIGVVHFVISDASDKEVESQLDDESNNKM